MSENSSDSDSSCGWTIISREGSNSEMVTSVRSTDSWEPGREPPELQAQQGESSQDGTSFTGETAGLDLTLETEEEKSPEDNIYFGAASDDSDIVTLEPPKLEEAGSQDAVTAEETPASEDFMGSSSSSQYTFCQPEAVFSSQRDQDGSSSEEASDQPSPAFRRRRARRKTAFGSESEEQPPAEQDPTPPTEQQKHQFSGGLNKCVVLAVVIAVSMGLGHFCGTIQRERWQQLVPKTPGNEASDTVGHLAWHPQQGTPPEVKTLKESLRRCRLLTAVEKMSLEAQRKRLATHNHHLRASLEKGERTMGSLQEELWKLREQIKILEGRGTSAELVIENQKLKQHLEDAEQKTHRFLNQKEILLAETKMLRSELEREQKLAASLRMEIVHLQTGQQQAKSDSPQEKKEIAVLQEKLGELEQKLNFEQQRSDLWERLYIEAKDQNGKPDTGKQRAGRGSHRAKSKSKETFLGTVKETFDAMKNSTKAFVRHHKEKIKQAKEAMKENLKKFSESVKSTFRHFKDTTKALFDEKGNKRFGAAEEAETEKKGPVFTGRSHPKHEAPSPNQKHRGPSVRRAGSPEQGARGAWAGGATFGAAHGWQGDCHSPGQAGRQGFESVQPEPSSPCNMVVSPLLVAEFREVIRRYLLKELGTFHHWEELNEIIDQYITNGLTNQKTFADFVNDVKNYLKSMQEYRLDNGVFEKLDGYIGRYFADCLLPLFGPSRPGKKQRMVNIENSRHGKQQQKHRQPQPCKQEGKWHKWSH
uniref:Cell cycle progression protein 1 isoform 3 n=1 Tax=Heterocephalus glaber TaxID=10181 RepID=A0A0P6JIC7_HETGA